MDKQFFHFVIIGVAVLLSIAGVFYKKDNSGLSPASLNCPVPTDAFCGFLGGGGGHGRPTLQQAYDASLNECNLE